MRVKTPNTRSKRSSPLHSGRSVDCGSRGCPNPCASPRYSKKLTSAGDDSGDSPSYSKPPPFDAGDDPDDCIWRLQILLKLFNLHKAKVKDTQNAAGVRSGDATDTSDLDATTSVRALKVTFEPYVSVVAFCSLGENVYDVINQVKLHWSYSEKDDTKLMFIDKKGI